MLANLTLPIALPLARHRMRQRRRSSQQELLAVGNAAVVFPPRHFDRVGREVRAGDVVMNTNLSAADAGEEAFGLVRIALGVRIVYDDKC